jgi:hypothetical protein
MENIVLMVIGFVAAAFLGYLIGKNKRKTQGEIQFVVEKDENGEDCINSVFKIDFDLEELLYDVDRILFKVTKTPEVDAFIAKKRREKS